MATNTAANLSADEIEEALEAARLVPWAHKTAAAWAVARRGCRTDAMAMLSTLATATLTASPLWWGALEVLETERMADIAASRNA